LRKLQANLTGQHKGKKISFGEFTSYRFAAVVGQFLKHYLPCTLVLLRITLYKHVSGFFYMKIKIMQKIKELIVPTPVQRSHPTYKQGMNQMFI